MSVASFYADDRLGARFGASGRLWPGGHHGQDVRAAAGTRIPSYVTGVVVSNFYSPGLGWVLVIRATDGWYYGYCHMLVQSPYKVGAWVSVGTHVGQVGSTGSFSTGPHLHTTREPSVAIGTNRATDPLPIIEVARTTTAGGGVTPFPPESPEEDDMPEYIFTNEQGNGYALVDSNYIDGCIITGDPAVAAQLSWASWNARTQGAPTKMSRSEFNAKLAAVVALWRQYAYKGQQVSVDVDALADAVTDQLVDELIEKLGPTVATDADLDTMRAEIIATVNALPQAIDGALADDFAAIPTAVENAAELGKRIGNG